MGTTCVTAPWSNFKTTLPGLRNDACKLVRGKQQKETLSLIGDGKN